MSGFSFKMQAHVQAHVIEAGPVLIRVSRFGNRLAFEVDAPEEFKINRRPTYFTQAAFERAYLLGWVDSDGEPRRKAKL